MCASKRIKKYYCGVGSRWWWHGLLHGEIEVGQVHGTLGDGAMVTVFEHGTSATTVNY